MLISLIELEDTKEKYNKKSLTSLKQSGSLEKLQGDETKELSYTVKKHFSNFRRNVAFKKKPKATKTKSLKKNGSVCSG